MTYPDIKGLVCTFSYSYFFIPCALVCLTSMYSILAYFCSAFSFIKVLDATFDTITPLAVERMPAIMCKHSRL